MNYYNEARKDLDGILKLVRDEHKKLGTDGVPQEEHLVNVLRDIKNAVINVEQSLDEVERVYGISTEEYGTNE